ncbi:MAG: hypothetical protein VCB43_14950, partial [Myxococcota bacterium]
GLADFSEGDLSSSLWWLQGLALRFGLVALLYLPAQFALGVARNLCRNEFLRLTIPVFLFGWLV